MELKKFSMNSLLVVMLAVILFYFFFVTPGNPEVAEHEGDIHTEAQGGEELFDWLVVLLGLGAVFVAYNITKKIGILARKPFLFFTIALGFFALLRIFFLLADLGIHVHHSTIHFYWHLLFYFGGIVFLYGLLSMNEIASNIRLNKGKDQGIFSDKDKKFLWIMGIISLFVFLSYFIFDNQISNFVYGSIFDGESSSLIHFLAFIIGVYVITALVNSKRNFGGTFTTSFYPFLGAIGLLVTVHFWELLTESWKVMNIADSVIESVEGVLVILAFVLFITAFWKIKSKLKI